MSQSLSSAFSGFSGCDTIALSFRNLIFFFCLLYLSVEDLKRFRIPDWCLGISVTAWCVAIPFAYQEYGGWNSIVLHLLAAAVYGGGIFLFSILMGHIWKKDSLGGGDVKLIAVMGLYLGMTQSLYALFYACVFGLIIAFLGGKSYEENGGAIPLGPALAAATWLMLVYGSYLGG